MLTFCLFLFLLYVVVIFVCLCHLYIFECSQIMMYIMYQTGIHASSAVKPQSSVVLAAHKLYVDAAFLVPSLYVFVAVEDSATTV